MDWSVQGGPLRIGGHRGAPDVAPENTIVGFQAAQDAGCEYIETDIRRSADGHLVVLHDSRVERTTDGTGRASQLTVAQLLALDAGSGFDARFAGARIPTLDELMAWLAARPGFGAVIEAKADGVGADIARAIAASPVHRDLSICSFKRAEIEAAKAAVPDVPCVILFHSNEPVADPVAETRSCGADGADIPWQWLTAAIADDMHAAGLVVGGGTANDADAVERLIGVRADFVDTDAPTTTVPARARLLGGR